MGAHSIEREMNRGMVLPEKFLDSLYTIAVGLAGTLIENYCVARCGTPKLSDWIPLLDRPWALNLISGPFGRQTSHWVRGPRNSPL